MTKIGYHISHEQFAPGQLLQLAQKAEQAGFSFCVSSDHFHPWNSEQGQSGFPWSWLGAAMATTKLDYGIVNCPCYRYHPAIIAQAVATLDEMFPNRFWINVGSGQLLNEGITGQKWPIKAERNAKLKEAVEIMRALWNGETVTHHGLNIVEGATLYTRPKSKIRVAGAAITPETAAWFAPWADALITVSKPPAELQKVVDAWRSNGGENKPMIIKVQISYDKTMKEAVQGAHEQWKTNIFGSSLLSDLRTPKQLEQAAQFVNPEEMHGPVNISDSADQHIGWLKKYESMGFSEIDLHNVNLKQEQFMQVFSEKVLPFFG